LVGAPYGFSIREDVDVSPKIQSVSDVWTNYLIEIGAIPDSIDKRKIARLEKDDE
jgi:hypothetical protein